MLWIWHIILFYFLRFLLKIVPEVNATTDGVVRAPSAFSMTLACFPSMTATQEFVVPKSIPTTAPVTPFDMEAFCWYNPYFWAITWAWTGVWWNAKVRIFFQLSGNLVYLHWKLWKSSHGFFKDGWRNAWTRGEKHFCKSELLFTWALTRKWTMELLCCIKATTYVTKAPSIFKIFKTISSL